MKGKAEEKVTGTGDFKTGIAGGWNRIWSVERELGDANKKYEKKLRIPRPRVKF